ncbi:MULTISPECIES: CoA transferase [unclassified Pseudofrankia]|uniref:CaiB/BaiF CoA-transferase family protein n=1 Tax=unclassified Pseudofrankia TaxID=2994372 RepID=UPI0018E3B482|nr:MULTISPECIES: CoA transferase [unclassified Pseudofrankia]MDT3439844.1 CoA transferase [Pseudofrankia sp. BMG5.37]
MVVETKPAVAARDEWFRPLARVRALDTGRWVAAPWCAQVLSWLGADVSRLEPPGGDPLLALADGPASTARCLYDDANRGKHARTASTPEEYARLLRAGAAAVDVLVDDHTPAELAALGVDLADLTRRHPALVIVSVTGHGLTGSAADRPASELTAYHAGGEGATLPSENVYRLFPDRPPVRAGRFLADHDAGLTAAVGALAALAGRRRRGTGDVVEVAGDQVERGLNRTTLSRAWFEGRDYDRTYRGYDYAGALRCLDGWVAIRPVEERHWRSFCQVLGRPELADDPRFADRGRRYDNATVLTHELESWTSTVTREAVRRVLLEAGCPGGPFLEPGELAADPAIASRGLFGPVVGGGVAPTRSFLVRPAEKHAARAGEGATPPALSAGRLPLSGLRVVDLTWVAAGPYATELLAFLGADVVRVESPTAPDLFRRDMANAGADLDSSIRFMDLNQAKSSVLADLKSPAGRERVLRLVEAADVLVENYRPGVRDRLGLCDETLRVHRPDLVILSLSGFGADALDADRPGYASVFNAEGGLGAMTGYPDAPPSDIRDTNDLRAGTNGALGVLAGLLHAWDGGGGVTVDAAARDALVVLQGHLVLAASRGGRPLRAGNTVEFAAPYDCFPTLDRRWVAVAARTDEEWAALADLLGPAAADPALRASRARVARRAEVDALVAAYTSRHDAASLVARMTAAGVPAGLSAAASDLAADDDLVTRGALRGVEHPRLGQLTLVGSPFRLRSCPDPVYPRPPLLGEHTDEIERRWDLAPRVMGP